MNMQQKYGLDMDTDTDINLDLDMNMEMGKTLLDWRGQWITLLSEGTAEELAKIGES